MDGDRTEERIAENQSLFRTANENIESAAVDARIGDGIPFVCECPDRSCVAIVHLTLADYEAVRTHPQRFVSAHGHEDAEVAAGRAAIVESRDGYVVVDKLDGAAAVAEAEYRKLEGRE